MSVSAKMPRVPQVRVPQVSPILRDLGIPLPEAREALALSTLVASAVFLIQWRYGFNWSDEGLLWYISQRTALGEIPLRDFFSYDPGRYYWSAVVFKILRADGLFEQIAANYLFSLVGLVATYFAVLRAGMPRAWRILTLLLLGVTLGFPRHKIFEQALSLLAVAGIAFVMEKPAESKRWLFYGILTGLAAFVGRNSGVYFAAAGLGVVFLLRFSGAEIKSRNAILAGALGMTIGYSPVLIMVCFVRGFASAFYQSVLFTPNWQHRLLIPFPWHVHLSGLHGIDVLQARAVSMLCLIVPLAYAILVLHWIRSRRGRDKSLGLACGASIAGLPYLHQAFSRADFFHIAQSILPFVLAISALASYFWMAHRKRLSLVLFSCLSAFVLIAWLPYEPAIQFARMRNQGPRTIQQIDIQGKTFYVATAQGELMHSVQAAFQNCGSRDARFLAAPYYPGLYPFLHTRAPFWELYYLYPRDEEFQMRHIAALVRNNTSLVLLNRAAAVDGLDSLRIGNTYPKLVDYVLAHYQRVKNMDLREGFELYSLPQNCRGPA